MGIKETLSKLGSKTKEKYSNFKNRFEKEDYKEGHIWEKWVEREEERQEDQKRQEERPKEKKKESFKIWLLKKIIPIIIFLIIFITIKYIGFTPYTERVFLIILIFFVGITLIWFYLPLSKSIKKIILIIFVIIYLFIIFTQETGYYGESFIQEAKKTLSQFKCFIMTAGQDPTCWEDTETGVEKIGDYKALDVHLAKTRITLGPGNAKYDNSQSPRQGEKYYLDLVLENNNPEDSDFDINVTSLEVFATTDINSFLPEQTVVANVNLPVYRLIRPFGYMSLRVEFDENNRIPASDYIYFLATVTTEQVGGGATTVLFLPDYDPEYEMMAREFSQTIKVTSGPVDFYVLTYPSVIPLASTPEFDIVIRINNQGRLTAGEEEFTEAKIKEIQFYQVFENLGEYEKLPFEIKCENSERTECPNEKRGNCLIIYYNNTVGGGESRDIQCEGFVTGTINKPTSDIISVIVQYEYTQDFWTRRKTLSS